MIIFIRGVMIWQKNIDMYDVPQKLDNNLRWKILKL